MLLRFRPCIRSQFRGVAALVGLFALLAMPARALAANDPYATDPGEQTPKQKLLGLLPPDISDGLDINAWAWFSYLRTMHPDANYTDTVFSIDISKSFQQRVAFGFEGNLINADGQWRGELEQLYISMLLSPENQTLITFGKFNANFGLEHRDFWSRTHGTTSLLFSAVPQDIVGIMLGQPIGETGITLRPFVALDFQGQPEINQPPSAGMQIEFKPSRELRFSWTNWAGPGFVLFGGTPIRSPYPLGGYGYSEHGNAAALENWQGPNFYAERGGTLYFTDANLTWRPRTDLTFAAEFLLGTSGTSLGRWGWWGVALSADFDITDRLSIFSRFSFLDDSDWLITGQFEELYEASGGISCHITKEIEIRAEYRHDHGTFTRDTDSASVHLTVGF